MVRNWLAKPRQQRWHLHFTPTSAHSGAVAAPRTYREMNWWSSRAGRRAQLVVIVVICAVGLAVIATIAASAPTPCACGAG